MQEYLFPNVLEAPEANLSIALHVEITRFKHMSYFAKQTKQKYENRKNSAKVKTAIRQTQFVLNIYY